MTWTTLAHVGPAPRGRMYHSMLMLKSVLYILGGEADGAACGDDVSMLDLGACRPWRALRA